MLSFWENTDAVRRFAGPEPARAVFYPEDDRFLVERDLEVKHYEVSVFDSRPSDRAPDGGANPARVTA